MGEPKFFTLPDDLDWELAAINEIVKLLGNLKGDEQQRIVQYLVGRYGAKQP